MLAVLHPSGIKPANRGCWGVAGLRGVANRGFFVAAALRGPNNRGFLLAAGQHGVNNHGCWPAAALRQPADRGWRLLFAGWRPLKPILSPYWGRKWRSSRGKSPTDGEPVFFLSPG